jgi:hypothetical protein
MKTNGTIYQSYLLRLWCEADGDEWRASLENVVTHECHNFPNMSALFEFLNEHTGQQFLKFGPGKIKIDRSSETQTPVFYEYSEEEVQY